MSQASNTAPIIIKKYANRRLYHTGTSTYVTLEDLAIMVQQGDHFTVVDAKTNEDLTRSVLTQIIVEQENKGGQNLLPISFLRDIISFYGDSMQSLVPGFLESSFATFVAQTEEWRNTMADSLNSAGQPLEAQLQRNVNAFQRAMTMFSPFDLPTHPHQPTPSGNDKEADTSNDVLKQMQDQLAEMQQKIDQMDKKP